MAARVLAAASALSSGGVAVDTVGVDGVGALDALDALQARSGRFASVLQAASYSVQDAAAAIGLSSRVADTTN